MGVAYPLFVCLFVCLFEEEEVVYLGEKGGLNITR